MHLNNRPNLSTRDRLNLPIITARKCSLEKGNVFTRVCHSVHGGVCVYHVLRHRGMFVYPSIQLDRGWYGQRLYTTEMAIEPVGRHPTGMHSCFCNKKTMVLKLCINLQVILDPHVTQDVGVT